MTVNDLTYEDETSVAENENEDLKWNPFWAPW